MKKLIIWGTGSAIALAAAGAASIAIVGNKIETKMTTDTRQTLAKFAPLVSLEELKYEKTFTGATRTLKLKIGCGQATVPLTWRDQIQHGPLPGFKSIGGAVIDSEFVLSDQTKAMLRDAIGLKDAPLTIHSVVGLDGNVTRDIKLASFESDLPNGAGKVSSQGWKIRTEQKGAITQYNIDMPAMEFGVAAPDGSAHIAFKLLAGKSTGEYSNEKYWWLPTGVSRTQISHFDYSVQAPGMPELSFAMKDVKWDSKSSLENDLWNTSGDIKSDLDINGHEITQAHWQESLKRIHAPTLESVLLSFINKENANLMCQDSGGVEAINQKIATTLKELPTKLMALLPYNPQYSVDQVSASYLGKQGQASYSIGTQGVTAADIQSGSLNPALLKKMVLTGQVKIPKVWVGSIMQAFNENPQPDPQSDEQLNMMIGFAVAQGLVVPEGEFLVAKVGFKDGTLMLNGKTSGLPGTAPAAPQAPEQPAAPAQ